VVSLRDPDEADWKVIAELADAAVAGVRDAPAQDEWVTARRAFAGERCHHVLEFDGQVVGYCAIELSEPEAGRSFRIFVVTD
jgi:hypothetical protein